MLLMNWIGHDTEGCGERQETRRWFYLAHDARERFSSQNRLPFYQVSSCSRNKCPGDYRLVRIMTPFPGGATSRGYWTGFASLLHTHGFSRGLILAFLTAVSDCSEKAQVFIPLTLPRKFELKICSLKSLIFSFFFTPCFLISHIWQFCGYHHLEYFTHNEAVSPLLESCNHLDTFLKKYIDGTVQNVLYQTFISFLTASITLIKHFTLPAELTSLISIMAIITSTFHTM